MLLPSAVKENINRFPKTRNREIQYVQVEMDAVRRSGIRRGLKGARDKVLYLLQQHSFIFQICGFQQGKTSQWLIRRSHEVIDSSMRADADVAFKNIRRLSKGFIRFYHRKGMNFPIVSAQLLSVVSTIRQRLPGGCFETERRVVHQPHHRAQFTKTPSDQSARQGHQKTAEIKLLLLFSNPHSDVNAKRESV